MGIQMQAIKCPHCGQVYSDNNGPHWTRVPGPGPAGGVTLIYTCMGAGCGQFIGVAFVPAQ